MLRSADFEDARGQLDQEQVLEDPPHAEGNEHRDRNGERPAHGIDEAQQLPRSKTPEMLGIFLNDWLSCLVLRHEVEAERIGD